jgi:hypothetical protein
MRVKRVITTVSAKGILELELAEFAGQKVEIIILPISSENQTDNIHDIIKMQENSGFLQTVLADSAEDVWNDL